MIAVVVEVVVVVDMKPFDEYCVFLSTLDDPNHDDDDGDVGVLASDENVNMQKTHKIVLKID